MNVLSAVGLIYDIAGVILLAWAILAVSGARLREQAATMWDFNPKLLRALIEQQTDAFVGLPCLAIGFVLQLLGMIGWLTPDNPLWWLLCAVLLVAVLVYLLFLRRWQINRRFAALSKRAGEGEVSQADVVLQSRTFGG